MAKRAPSDWEQRFASFLERVMATAVTGGDPKPLQEEYARLYAEAPPAKRKLLTPLAGPKKEGTDGSANRPAKG
jgi:hypothetical protein